MSHHKFLLLVILIWQLYSSSEQLRLEFQRTINAVTLFCYDERDVLINLAINTSVKFFVNRTDGNAMDLEQMGVQLENSETSTTVTFIITPELEGHFSCAMVTPQITVASPTKTLIALPSTDNFPANNERIRAVQSGRGEITVPCSYEPGMLQGCYFGEWTKNSTPIVKIGKPDMSCSPARLMIINNIDTSKYSVNRETFALIIFSPDAKVDSAQYECHLRVLNPATESGTAQFRSFPISLIVDGLPEIIYPPKEVVIGLDSERVGLVKTATFKCTAMGRPIPNIEWFYITIDQNGALGSPDPVNQIYVSNNDSDEDRTGRYNRISTLTMPVTEDDGGIIRCQAGASYADARLTILSTPEINIITTLRGEIVYNIGLKLHVNHPVMLKFTYVVNGRHLRRDRQPDELFNDTKEIIYRENKEQVPAECRKCRVNVSLIAMVRNEPIEGLSVVSSDEIDVGATTPEQTILGLTIGISVCGVVLAFTIGLVIAVVCCYQKRQLKLKQENKEERTIDRVNFIKEEMDNSNCSDEVMIRRIIDKLERLKKFIRTGADSSSTTSQDDLKHIDSSLNGIFSRLNLSQETEIP